jgi:hypothetical protein
MKAPKKKNITKICSMLFIFLLLSTSFGVLITTASDKHSSQPNEVSTTISAYRQFTVESTSSLDLPRAITVSDSNPFYSLIATPLAISYDTSGNQRIIPLYVKNVQDPSEAVERAENQIGIYTDFVISDIHSPKEWSLYVAQQFWQETTTALIIKDDFTGYSLGIAAAPLASYLNIPIIVTSSFDTEVNTVLDNLGVEYLYICGDLHQAGYWVRNFTSPEEVTNECLDVISSRFGETVSYITMANPLDISPPEVLDTITYNYQGTIPSAVGLPTQSFQILFRSIFGTHQFTIPSNYKYTTIEIDLTNLNSEDTELLGDRLTLMLSSPDGTRYVFGSTAGGLPLRDSTGKIIEDRLHFEITVYDKPGEYTLQIFGQWFARKQGSYTADITLKKLENPLVPLMPQLSSLAPYLTAYHKGILFTNESFAFAADDQILYNGEPCPGVTQPGMNYNLVAPANEHTMQIHQQLNELLATIAGISSDNLRELRDHYAEHPLYIAITADPTMVPMYFYYNPDGLPDSPGADFLGYALPSDFMWGDIDVKPEDPENNTYTYWPFQENIVGRVTGRDVQDLSALIARTIFYDNILDILGTWKDNALVSTGCGLEFQNLPVITRLSQILYSGRGEPTKFPTGESTFINLRLKEDMETGYDHVKNTFLLQSQREGFSDEGLTKIKQTGILNRLLFPKKSIAFWSSEEKVTGGQDHLNSNLIFSFAHGSYNLFEHGDVLIDSKGFPFVTSLARIYPKLRSGLSDKGSFDLRSVENMDYGPSVIFIESCITARTDGIPAANVLSQAFLHAGVNAYIGATRVTADPGYLEPRPLPNGWGIGTLGLIKAILDLVLRDTYPDLHFGAVIAEDFIKELVDNDATTGMALRNAKNVYLEKDANSTFLWTPPLTLSPEYVIFEPKLLQKIQPQGGLDGNDRTRTLDKKYVALHEFTLYGDPAFNPYQSINDG